MAAVTTAVVGTAVSLYGAKRAGDAQKDAARNASDAQLQSTQLAIDEQRRQFDLSRGDMMPWLESGKGALGRLDAASTGDMSQFQASPDYNFRLDQGMRSLDRNAAARGSLFGGGTDLDRINYGQGMASGEFGNWWNRQAGLAGVGQTAASGLGALGANSANSIGNMLMQGGNARASSYLRQGDATANQWGNYAGAFGWGLGQLGGSRNSGGLWGNSSGGSFMGNLLGGGG